MMFAELSGLEIGSIITSLVIGITGVVVGIIGVSKKQEIEISPQPLAVQVVEEMHKQFASLKDFNAHVANNTERHGQIFSRIDRVERTAREESEKRFDALNTERRETLEKLNDQFTFIRENIAAINRELQIKGK